MPGTGTHKPLPNPEEEPQEDAVNYDVESNGDDSHEERRHENRRHGSGRRLGDPVTGQIVAPTIVNTAPQSAFSWISPSKTVQILVSGGAAALVCSLFGVVVHQMLAEQKANNAMNATLLREAIKDSRDQAVERQKQDREDRKSDREHEAELRRSGIKHADEAAKSIDRLEQAVEKNTKTTEKLDGTIQELQKVLKLKKTTTGPSSRIPELAPVPRFADQWPSLPLTVINR